MHSAESQGEQPMAEKSRIRLNPTTKEIEIEGTEKFVREYFNVIHKMMIGSAKLSKKTAQKVAKARKPKKSLAAKKSSNTSIVLDLIKDSKKGITTTELEKKTGLVDKQIWGIIYHAEKAGVIRKVKRGVYTGAQLNV